MSRRLGILLAAGLVLAACGDSDPADPVSAQADSASDDPAADTAEPAGDGEAGGGGSGGDTAEPAEEPTGEEPAAPSGGSTPADDATGKPSVELPATEVTELVVTELVEGSGEGATTGDTIALDYVGVLSADGTEFDTSYGSGQPLTFRLGVDPLIDGFTQGLEGVKTGERRQLDIPAELAYGEQGAGDIIPPSAAITFVVDVVEVTKRVPPEFPPQADPSECPATDGSEEQVREFAEYPPFCIDAETTYSATIVTNFGEFSIEFDQTWAPLTVNSFVTLARYKYFDGTECHRAIPGFVVQCGDPTATGSGGPGYQIPDELPLPGEYEIGSIAMANAGPNTSGSQFFIITGDNGAGLPPQYSLFGEVIGGLDTTVSSLDAVANPDDNGQPPLEQIIIESVTITES